MKINDEHFWIILEDEDEEIDFSKKRKKPTDDEIVSRPRYIVCLISVFVILILFAIKFASFLF
nr:MAG TPA: hypothetical protein [Bacteriophage sp.]